MRDAWRWVAAMMHEPDEAEAFAPAVCAGCGGVTCEGIMLFPTRGDGMLPVCGRCMGAAMARRPRTFQFDRSPN